jgi:hypothetical protein
MCQYDVFFDDRALPFFKNENEESLMARNIPFEFVLEEIASLEPHVKPMFGAWGVYVGNKIVFILREKPSMPTDNGVWIATAGEHHASLQRELPCMRSLEMFGPGPTAWQNLPSEADDFEEAALKACQLVLSGDPRIGKIPNVRMKKKVKKKRSTRKE